MKKLNADLKNRSFERVYLLYGNEEYLKQSFKKRLQKAICGNDEMNLMISEGKEQNAGRLQEFTDTMPFFADKRVVILTDTGLFKGASEGFSEWIGALPETACVIFSESEIDKRNRLYKKVQEIGYAAELNHPDADSLGKWMLQILKSRNMEITRDAYERILEGAGPDMESVQNELRKVMDYCMLKGSITLQDVEEILSPKVTSRIFEMVECVALGNRQRSLALYYDLMALKEPPMRILFLIARQLNQLLLVKEMVQNRKSRDEIAAALSVRPFVAGKLQDQARRFTVQELKRSIEQAVQFEYDVKTGNLNETLAVELLILSGTARNA